VSRSTSREISLAKNTKIADLEPYFKDIARTLARQKFEKKYAEAEEILKLVGAGVFLAASLVAPGLSRLAGSLIYNSQEKEAWKRFNLPYLKRTLNRLERQKLVTTRIENGQQIVEITEVGKRRILRLALNETTIKKPASWDGYWRLVSYDIPKQLTPQREVLAEYLKVWGFYPFHQSVYLHAYPCEKQIEFLREYLGIGRYVRILKVAKIENDQLFRDFFGV